MTYKIFMLLIAIRRPVFKISHSGPKTIIADLQQYEFEHMKRILSVFASFQKGSILDSYCSNPIAIGSDLLAGRHFA
jgi:hypothetical protein